MTERVYQLPINFSEEAYAELVLMERDLHVDSKGEVIRQALGALKWLVKKLDNEGKIIIVENDKEVEVQFESLQNLKNRQIVLMDYFFARSSRAFLFAIYEFIYYTFFIRPFA